ncbi:P-loop containing nucleoside triphosphate hydrolase protein [Punctularia strigosozonata HHB-11173 SS5]|uniref:P-loop containing nucleoside triphosphate hydrolase protein n=1 Tax=Punctularia strigosozonata (strain HHB-11173) TaxID=741275 RepID=UPI0004417B8A|nr:P-loop containing nucleoside triphosphate hydrolase protein [Punctularia strigosozonata HHB-11173 SS5]EIN13242.1 P-loop containing nucleoside triphosphate hydrolase protein [Punctularia strigosozonata HHB-11173 SS5]
MQQDLPYIWITLKEILSLRRCWYLCAMYVIISALSALLPATSLWYSGQLLSIVQTAVETRTVDRKLLFRIAAGRILCAIGKGFLHHLRMRVTIPLQSIIKQHYSVHVFHHMARLDVPTFEDPAVYNQFRTVWPKRGSVAFETMKTLVDVGSQVVQFISQFSVLMNVLRDQPDAMLTTVLTFIPIAMEFAAFPSLWSRGATWAATVRNEHFVRATGLKALIMEPSHRKEIAATADLPNHLSAEYEAAVIAAGPDAAPFHETHRNWMMISNHKLFSLLKEPFRELPQIVFTLRAVKQPAEIPVSLASLELVKRAAHQCTNAIVDVYMRSGGIGENLSSLRKLYNIEKIANRVADGKVPFPEDQQSIRNGISLEFRNVSFRYPGTEKWALRHVSFNIPQGGLCVIVGSNGSGKSTVLKLIARLYDPDEGEILLGGVGVKTVRLDDLRRALSVLFQDFTHFPLQIKDNIGLGDPEHATDVERIQEAARLGGADEVIRELPDGLDTWLRRPVADVYSNIPEGTKTLFGKTVDFGSVREAGSLDDVTSINLSGGQLQRLAIARSFMRSLPSSKTVGLLLFDEPSAALDPVAEHDLFERLRGLRGSKTMVFSTHRFGNLTRHADLILYMNHSEVKEAGNHDHLMKQQGEYARSWALQAKAFVD